MSFSKPEIITQEQLIEQMNTLRFEKAELTVHLHQLQHKLELIESSLAESEHLKKKKNTELLLQSIELFNEEWKRKSTYFPDIRLASLEKIVAIASGPKKS